MVFGEERVFRINTILTNKCNEFYLRFCGTDIVGMKMKGDFPELWKKEDDKITGPQVFDDDFVYKIVKIDYESGLMWLEQI